MSKSILEGSWIFLGQRLNPRGEPWEHYIPWETKARWTEEDLIRKKKSKAQKR